MSIQRWLAVAFVFILSVTMVRADTFEAQPLPTGDAAQSRPGSGPAEPVEQQVLEDLQSLKRLLDGQDAAMARLVRERLQGRISPNSGEFAEDLTDCDRRLQEQMRQQQVRVTDEYIVSARKPDSPGWKRPLADAAQIIEQQSKNPKHAGVVVARIRLEDPTREEEVAVNCRDINSYTCCWGYGSVRFVANGGFVYLGAPYKEGPMPGKIEIEALAHRCPRIDVQVPAEGAEVFELIVRAIPRQECGELRIRVEPEAGVPLDGARVHVGRRHAGWEHGKKLTKDNTCTFPLVAPGKCDAYVEWKEILCSPHVQGLIKAGEVTEMTLKAYAYRQVFFEWRYRRKAGKGDWNSGSSTMLTGGPSPLNLWEENGSAFQLSVWDGKGATIGGMNGQVKPVDKDLFESASPVLPLDELRRSRGREPFPLELGGVYAVLYGRDDDGEALIHIKSITPVSELAGK